MYIPHVGNPLLFGISFSGKYDLSSVKISQARELPEILIFPLLHSRPHIPSIIQSC